MPVEVAEVPQAGATAIAATETRVEWLVDNAGAYEAILNALRGAQHSIRLSQLAFDADCVAYDEDGSATPLIDEIVAASCERSVEVRILLNESLLLDTATPLRRALAARGASAVEVRGVSRFPQLLHAKVLVVDDREAILIGSPFANGYWDTSAHAPTDGRRPDRELGGRPVHDLSVQVMGRTARELADEFDEWWNCIASGSSGEDALCGVRGRSKSEDVAGIGVATTVPRRVLASRPAGRTDVLHALTKAINDAERLIYIEHQYLSCIQVLDALTRALERSPELEIIALLNQNPDVTAYRGWQNFRLRERGLLAHPRVGLFTLWTREALPNDVWAVNQVFVHSKAVIIDGQWATVGSANIDGVSLHSYGADFTSRLGQWVFRDVRNIDVNILLDASFPETQESIAALHTALWSEHLGGEVLVDDIPASGWVAHWRDAAKCNIAVLNGASSATGDRSFVLPYSTAPRPRAQLKSLGVVEERLDVRFTPSWLEVHCSPNWIRNMFA